MERILIFGNSGSGKTTMARRLVRKFGLPHLDLDLLAWEAPGVRRELNASLTDIEGFLARNERWIVEGCYGDLIEPVVPYCTQMRFLDPSIESCIANCRSRPWEPEKYASPDEQDAMLDFLIDWVRQYETRTDEFSRLRHRTIFDSFSGDKRLYQQVETPN